MAVTVDAIGAGVSGAAPTSLSPVPPTGDKTGKATVLFVCMDSATPTITSVSVAGYKRAGKTTTGWRCSMWIKNGENNEPTPQVNFGSSTGQMCAWITTFSISGGDSFPTYANDGDGVLSFSEGDTGALTKMFYQAIDEDVLNGPVGGGWGVQMGMKGCQGGGWTFTSVNVSSGFTAAGSAAKVSGSASICGAAQLQNAATVFDSGLPAYHEETINTESSSDNVASVAVEFSVVPPAGGSSGSGMGGGMTSLAGGMRG